MRNLQIPQKTVVKIFVLAIINLSSLIFFIFSALGDFVLAPLTFWERISLFTSGTSSVGLVVISAIGAWRVFRSGHHDVVTGDVVSKIDDLFDDLGLWP